MKPAILHLTVAALAASILPIHADSSRKREFEARKRFEEKEREWRKKEEEAYRETSKRREEQARKFAEQEREATKKREEYLREHAKKREEFEREQAKKERERARQRARSNRDLIPRDPRRESFRRISPSAPHHLEERPPYADGHRGNDRFLDLSVGPERFPRPKPQPEFFPAPEESDRTEPGRPLEEEPESLPSPREQPQSSQVDDFPFGARISGKESFVCSPFDDRKRPINVDGLSRGTKVWCPYTNRIFRVP